MIVPDLRGYGDSDISEKDEYDLALYSRDLYALVHDRLGHERCGLLGGDVGGGGDLRHGEPLSGLRRPDGLLQYRRAHGPGAGGLVRGTRARSEPPAARPHGRLPHPPGARLEGNCSRSWTRPRGGDATCATSTSTGCWLRSTPSRKRTTTSWSSLSRDARRLYAGWAPYQLEYGRPQSEPALLGQPVGTPTLVLYGPDDQIVPKDFPKRCEIGLSQSGSARW